MIESSLDFALGCVDRRERVPRGAGTSPAHPVVKRLPTILICVKVMSKSISVIGVVGV